MPITYETKTLDPDTIDKHPLASKLRNAIDCKNVSYLEGVKKAEEKIGKPVIVQWLQLQIANIKKEKACE